MLLSFFFTVFWVFSSAGRYTPVTDGVALRTAKLTSSFVPVIDYAANGERVTVH